jgi:hypothetical protein
MRDEEISESDPACDEWMLVADCATVRAAKGFFSVDATRPTRHSSFAAQVDPGTFPTRGRIVREVAVGWRGAARIEARWVSRRSG